MSKTRSEFIVINTDSRTINIYRSSTHEEAKNFKTLREELLTNGRHYDVIETVYDEDDTSDKIISMARYSIVPTTRAQRIY